MSGHCQTAAQWSNTNWGQPASAAPVLSGNVFAAAHLDLHSSLFKSAVESSGDALAICACAGESPIIIYANPAFCAMMGYEMIELYGQRYDFMVAASGLQSERARMEEAIAADRSATLIVRCTRRDESKLTVALRISPVQNPGGCTTHYLLSARQSDEEQHRIEQLRFLAHHDTLTGLPNRRLLLDRLDRALTRYERCGEGFTVAFVDLDRFKEINDAFGHAAGDALLKHVAACLSRSVRASDTVGRLGGDEFLLLLSCACSESDVHESLVRVLTSLSEPLNVTGQSMDVSCSIGVAVCPRDGNSASELLRRADEAMYRAKRRARGAP